MGWMGDSQYHDRPPDGMQSRAMGRFWESSLRLTSVGSIAPESPFTVLAVRKSLGSDARDGLGSRADSGIKIAWREPPNKAPDLSKKDSPCKLHAQKARPIRSTRQPEGLFGRTPTGMPVSWPSQS